MNNAVPYNMNSLQAVANAYLYVIYMLLKLEAISISLIVINRLWAYVAKFHQYRYTKLYIHEYLFFRTKQNSTVIIEPYVLVKVMGYFVCCYTSDNSVR